MRNIELVRFLEQLNHEAVDQCALMQIKLMMKTITILIHHFCLIYKNA